MSISTESVHSGGYVLIRYEGMIGGDDVDQGHAVMKKGSEGTWLDTGLDAPKKFLIQILIKNQILGLSFSYIARL
jgi:hypothetical protein